VDAAQDGHAERVEGPGDRLVGLDHEHLDDRVGEGVVLGDGVGHAPLVVEDQFHLRQVEHDHAVTDPAFAQDASQAVAAAQRLDQLVGVAGLGARVLPRELDVPVDEGLRLQVGQTLVGADDRRGHPLVEDASAGAEGDEDRLGETLDTLLQRADAVGERLGEHRDDETRQVDAVAAQPRLFVEGGPGSDEVGDVGDVDAQRPLVGLLVVRERDCVVEVAGIGWVDRDRVGAGEILATAPGRLEGAGRRRGRLLDRVGELAAQTVGDDDRLGLDVGLARGAEDAGDHALGHVVVLGIVEQLDDHLVAGLGVLGVRVPDQHGLVERATAGIDEPHPPALEEHAHEVLAAALEDLDDLACVGAAPGAGLAPPALLADRRAHAVPRDRVAGAALRHEEVAVAHRHVGDDEAEAAGVEPEGPDDLGPVLRKTRPAVVAHLQTPVLDELRHGLLEEIPLVRLDGEIVARGCDG
jgi:hypothetical protein